MNPVKRSGPVLHWLSLVAVVLIIASCTNERPVYQGAEYYKNLEVPPDLTEPDRADELKVPKPTDEALQRFRDNNKLETVITPKFDGVRIVSYAGNSWIEIDNNVDQVWPKLLEFWQREGFEMVQVRPLLGFMETDWTERLGGDRGFIASMFQKFEPDAKDKFRVRVEAFDDGNKTRLYLAHSRIERVIYGEYGDQFYWKTLPSNLEAEREIISRMAVFAGLTKEQSATLLENYRPYASLVKVDSTNTTALTMKGSMDFVWRRSMRALDRMRMQDVQGHKESSTIDFSVGKIPEQDLELDTAEDELAKSSWLMQLFTGSDGDEALASDVKRKYRLEFTDLGGRIQIEVKDARNSQQTDDDGDVYSTALAEQLRDLLVEKLE
jgi:outer membrane protein assembly factor BamC